MGFQMQPFRALVRWFPAIALIACAAFLVIVIQPLVGILLLPSVGAHPLLWPALQVAFQTLLLMGYLVAMMADRRLLIGLFSLSVLATSIIPAVLLPPQPNETLSLLPAVGTVALAVGFPFLGLCTASILIQQWAAGIGNATPHWLYAFSSMGSLLGTLVYPFSIQSAILAATQLWYWQAATTVVLIALGIVAIRMPTDKRRPDSFLGIIRLRWVWILAGFLAVSLLLTLTNYLTLDWGSHPVAWLAPLAVYLAATALSFARCEAFLGPIVACLTPGASILALIAIRGGVSGLTHTGIVLVLLGCVGVLITAITLWALDRRPPPAGLSAFYTSLALGGVAAAIAIAFLSPMALNPEMLFPEPAGGLYSMMFASVVPEFVLIVIGTNVVLFRYSSDDITTRAIRFVEGLVIGVVIVALLKGLTAATAVLPVWVVMTAIVTSCAAVGFAVRSSGHRKAMVLGAAALVVLPSTGRNNVVLHTRSPFGQLIVADRSDLRTLQNGTTIHGSQLLSCTSGEDDRACAEPVGYYHPSGPLGSVFGAQRSRAKTLSVAVVGLGVGSISAYCKPGDSMTFIEIDPSVVRIAQKYFRYIEFGRQNCHLAIEAGDGRVALRSGRLAGLDILIVDAFSSDSVPAHLLTVEAFGEYGRLIKQSGVMAVHISSRFFDLDSPVQAAAAANGMKVLLVHGDGDLPLHSLSSLWAIVALEETAIAALRTEILLRPLSQARQSPLLSPAWLDGRYSILSALR